jgi:CheY-like chemotaxis protein
MDFRLFRRRAPRPVEDAGAQDWLVASPPPSTAARAPLPIPDIRLNHEDSLPPDLPGGRPIQAELRPIAVRKRVAVVDDEPMVLDVLCRILANENVEIIRAGSGPALVAALDREPDGLDLLITDYAMPEMHGRELARLVRQRCPSVKVLYQTGYADQLFGGRPELEDGAAFVEKPVTARALREAARLALFGALNEG